jgi:hypothetical protein
MKLNRTFSFAFVAATLLANGACSSPEEPDTSEGSDSALSSDVAPLLGTYIGKEQGKTCDSTLTVQRFRENGIAAVLLECTDVVRANGESPPRYVFAFPANPSKVASACNSLQGDFGGVTPDQKRISGGSMADFIRADSSCQDPRKGTLVWRFQAEGGDPRVFVFKQQKSSSSPSAPVSPGGANVGSVRNSTFPILSTSWSCNNGNSTVFSFRSTKTLEHDVTISNVEYQPLHTSNEGGDDGIPGSGSPPSVAKDCRANDDETFGVTCGNPKIVLKPWKKSEVPAVGRSFTATLEIPSDPAKWQAVRCEGLRYSP